jgi:hypothetical protein
MNKAAHGVGGHKAHKPEQHQDDGYSFKHGDTSIQGQVGPMTEHTGRTTEGCGYLGDAIVFHQILLR